MKNFLITILVLCGLSLIGIFFYYEYADSPVDTNSKAKIEFTIPKGMSTNTIARKLKEQHLIKSDLFFKVMVKLNKSKIIASSYLLEKNMSTTEIIKELSKGSLYNPDAINITFKEGEKITDYATTISKKTSNSSEDFLNTVKDKAYVSELIKKYWFLTDDILNDNIYYPLEGYLAPNTYEFKNKEVTCKEIIEKMLDQTDAELSPYKKRIQQQNDFTIHQYFTLASMAQLEINGEQEMKVLVGIFLNRIDAKMNLGVDATTYYGLQVPMDHELTAQQFNEANAYNTRNVNMIGLPVGPICNPSMEAIRASLDPESSDYLYYVTDKNRKIYYSKTEDEHIKKIAEIKEKGDWIW